MKRTFTLLAAIAISSFSFMGGCVSKITTVHFDYQASDTITTSAYTTTGNQTFANDVVTSGLEAELKKNGASLNNLDELKLKAASVEFDPVAGQNFDAIDNIELYLSTSTLPEIKVAFKNPVGKGLSKVDLDLTSSDLSGYVKSPTFNVTIKGSNNTALPKMHLRYSMTWDVKASVK